MRRSASTKRRSSLTACPPGVAPRSTCAAASRAKWFATRTVPSTHRIADQLGELVALVRPVKPGGDEHGDALARHAGSEQALDQRPQEQPVGHRPRDVADQDARALAARARARRRVPRRRAARARRARRPAGRAASAASACGSRSRARRRAAKPGARRAIEDLDGVAGGGLVHRGPRFGCMACGASAGAARRHAGSAAGEFTPAGRGRPGVPAIGPSL